MTSRVVRQSSDRQVAGLILLSSPVSNLITKNSFFWGGIQSWPTARVTSDKHAAARYAMSTFPFSGTTMLNLSNNGPDELLQQATQLHNAGNLQGAEHYYRQVLAVEPNHPAANNLLGLLAMQMSKFRDAAEMFRRAIGEKPEFAAAHSNLASALTSMNRGSEAILHYRLALELDPELPGAPQLLAELLARMNLPPFPEPDPDFAGPLAQYAGVLAGRKRILPAIRLYERSLDQNPEQPEALEVLGGLLLQAKQSPQAVASFRRALELGRKTAAVYHGLASALHKLFEFKPAMEACNEALKLEPDNLDVQWTQNLIQADIHKFEVAIRNIKVAIAKDPNNKELQFQLAALSGERPVAALPTSHVVDTFDKYAATFDSHLVQRLNYRGPQIILQLILAASPGQAFDILDLGCGTGLCGAALKPVAKRMEGVDLSAGMIERCRQRGIYDELQVADLVAILRGRMNRYDLITAADVFEYVGVLEDVFAGAAGALRPGGLFAFSVIRTDEAGVVLNRGVGSYMHNLAYLQELAQKHGLTQVMVNDTPVRTNFGRPVPSWTVLLRKPG